MLINSVAYHKGVRRGDVPLEEISAALEQPDTFLWLGLFEPDAALLGKIQQEFHLHDLAVEDAREAHQRPKLEEYGNNLFIVLKTAQLHNDELIYGETHLFVGQHFLISVRHGPSTSHVGVREHCEKLPRMLAKGPGFALYALMDFVVDHYKPIVDQFEKELEDLEALLFRGDADNSVMERMYGLKRNLLHLRNIVLPIGDICTQCTRFHDDVIARDLRVYFRDVQDHVTRLVGVIDALREMLSAAMQLHLALVTVRQNEVVKSLAGWGAILAIPTVVFSMYGMNFSKMPELHWIGGYPLTLVGTALGCLYLYRRLKRAGWV